MLYVPAAGAVKPLTVYLPVESVKAFGMTMGDAAVKVIVVELNGVPVDKSVSIPVTEYTFPCTTEPGKAIVSPVVCFKVL